MKMNRDKLKKMFENKYTKPLIFFGFYFIFFTVILLIISHDRTQIPANIEKDIWDDITTNYEYRYDVTLSDNQVISLEGKKYNNKNLFTKKINDVTDSEVYIFYNDIKIKRNNTWADDDSFVLINNSFDNQLLDTKYIKALVSDSELMTSTTDFDGTKSDNYVFGNINIEIMSSQDVLKKIVIIHPQYKLTLQYKNINNVEDFVVEK